MVGRLIPFPRIAASPDDGAAAARRALAIAIGERAGRAAELSLEEPEVLLQVSALVRALLHTDAARGHDEASFFYTSLQEMTGRVGLFDEHEYFLGEFALSAGIACRQLSLREEAKLWFDRAESGYRHTVNAVADLSRLAYQRLALRMEERQLDAVLELAPSLVRGFARLGMREDEIKARFLEGLALMESDRLEESVAEFTHIVELARAAGSERLVAEAYGNLTHVYGLMGDPENAIRCSQAAVLVLERLNDRFALAKVRWGLANLLRKLGQIDAAIQAYRVAQRGFAEIGMRADVAALNLVVADLQIETGDESSALQSVLAALPVLDELQMIPEGMAAFALLQESIRHQHVNRQALRELHGYFDEAAR